MAPSTQNGSSKSRKFLNLAFLISLIPIASAAPQIPQLGLHPSVPNAPLQTAVNTTILNLNGTATGAPFPTNGGYVSNGSIHQPQPDKYSPHGGIGINQTVAINGTNSTGFGQVYPTGFFKTPIPLNATFASPLKTNGSSGGAAGVSGGNGTAGGGQGGTQAMAFQGIGNNGAGIWNGTYALNSTEATYNPTSDFDYQSLQLALYQEYIELDLFQRGLQMFTTEDFEKAGLTSEDRALVEFMAEQEVGHAKLISDILGPSAPKPCTYNYPFTDVVGWIDFSQLLTKWGEAGVYGFLPHLDSRPTAQLLLQSITTEARQQMIFRQFEGLFPMPVWFEPAISQSMAWTDLAPYIVACPAENKKMVWQNFPALSISNAPNGTAGFNSSYPAITHNRTMTTPGQQVTLNWEDKGKPVGPNGTYITDISPMAGAPKYAAWISQLNTTYTPLENIQGNSAVTFQPGNPIWEGAQDPLVNGTMFVLITDEDLYVTPFNISRLNDHIIAGPAVYQSG